MAKRTKATRTTKATKATRTTPRPKSIRDLKRRKVKAEQLIKIPVEVDGESYVLYSRHLSLGAAASFTRLSRMDSNDPMKGADGIDAAREFLSTHVRDEDGSELPAEEIASIIDSLDMEFAAELVNSMIEFITGTTPSNDESDESGKASAPVDGEE